MTDLIEPSQNGGDSGAAEQLDRARRREGNARRTTLATIVARGGSALVSLVSLPIVLRHLGSERYGIWVTVSSVAAWLALLDLGLGLGLKNQVAASSGRDDKQGIERAISTASAVTLIPAGVLLLAVWLAAPLLDWRSMLNLGAGTDGREVAWVFIAAATLVLTSMWTNLGYAIVRGLQRGYLANYCGVAAAVVSLGATIAAAKLNAPLPVLAVALMGPGVTAPALLWLWVGRRAPHLAPRFRVHRDQARGLLGSGAGFFLIQMAMVVVFQMDNVIIARYCGPAEVTPYSVGARVMAMGTLLFSTYTAAMWPAFGEAAARGDWEWVRAAHARLRRIVTVGSIVAGVGFVALGPLVIPIWAGPAAQAEWPLYAWLAATAVVKNWTDTHATLLNGIDHIKPQVYSAVVHAVVTLGVSVLLAQRWGATGVAAAGFVGFLSVSAWWLPVAVRLVLADPSRSGGAGRTAGLREGDSPNRVRI